LGRLAIINVTTGFHEGDRTVNDRATRWTCQQEDFTDASITLGGAKLFYLPPYNPDLNPIEQAISKLKTLLRKVNA
jgi:transposase